MLRKVKGVFMNNKDELKRRIELKRQLIRWTENEIKKLEESLKKADSDDHAKRVNAPPLPPII